MPNRWQNKRRFGALIALTLAVGGLAGCATRGSTGDAAASDEQEPDASAEALLATGGTTASGRYIDPALVSATSVAEENSAPDGYGQQTQATPDLAGVVSQPTGIRAGSVSIFSGTPSVAVEPATAGTVPGNAGPGRVNATAGSVFSAPPAAPAYDAPACGTTVDGAPLSC